ncbi:MAG: CotH kinase family protein, partial [Lachnospiraceae bacterium]|nr:CotH kinase family protein [Lachnospiraceae bacterium]
KGGFGSGDASKLVYIDDDMDSYSVIFDSAVFEPTSEDKAKLIEALKNVSEGTNLEEYVDVDAMLRFIALNTFLVNDDGYFGTMVHNYYLYEEDGKLTMLPWDYNLAFGGFQSHDASSLINRGIDDVVSGNLEDRPMVAKLLEVEEYREQYYAWLEDLVSGYFESGHFAEVMDMLDELLDSYVAEDPTAFYTYEEYTEANEMLRVFCKKRAESIRKQLDGSLAKTASEQTSETKVETSDVTITVMGTQLGGGGHGMAGGRGGFSGDFGGSMPEDMDFSDKDFSDMDFSDMKFPGMESQQNNDMTALIWLGISAAVMAIGLLFVKLYPRSRY